MLNYYIHILMVNVKINMIVINDQRVKRVAYFLGRPFGEWALQIFFPVKKTRLFATASEGPCELRTVKYVGYLNSHNSL